MYGRFLPRFYVGSGGSAKVRDNVAIDGPAGAGKSTVARQVAEKL
ncbi:MAG: (d)CMP kinase, partial [Thermoanaerobacteraceae bacterium]|nr:(d)CMP kinase [Thermoanaerobacteraceae bacterium]